VQELFDFYEDPNFALAHESTEGSNKDVYAFFEFEDFEPVYLGSLDQRIRFKFQMMVPNRDFHYFFIIGQQPFLSCVMPISEFKNNQIKIINVKIKNTIIEYRLPKLNWFEKKVGARAI